VRLARRLERLQRVLPWTTVLEFALGAAVLISVGVLVQSTTAAGELRQDAGKPSGEFLTTGQQDDVSAALLIKPFGLGESTFTVTLTPVEPGQDIGEISGVRLLASYDDPNAPPSAGRSGTSQELESTGQPNVWSADAALLTQPGNWRVETRVQRREKDDVRIVVGVPQVGGILASQDQPQDLFDLPFTFVNWNIVAGGAMVAMGLGAFLIWRNRPPSWSFGTANAVAAASLFGLLAGVVLIVGVDVHRPVDTTTASPIRPTSESLARGRQLFEANCVQCHGRTGEGDGPSAGSLAIDVPRYVDHVPYHNDYTLFYWITSGIERDGVLNMPAWGDVLTDDERWTLVTFLRQTWGSGSFDPVLPDDLQTPSASTAPAPTRTPAP
jgi:mono/diheme cytochrome c family protein